MSSATQSEPAASASVLNIAAYKFVTLDDLPQRRQELKQLCQALDLRGTILLSPEGINLFLAGMTANVRDFLERLLRDPLYTDLDVKESYSEKCPFRRMLVRLKKEIISFGVDGVRPIERTSPKLSAKELKRWLDEGRPVRLLDTRNDYEVDLGTFVGAEHLSIGHFRQFPGAIEQLPAEAKRQPLVMFCTGGIRCEKAGPLMEQAGFEEVYQLEGGILKYFEQCGGDHYDGACFVFDGRVALNPRLEPTGNLLCFACQAVLTPEEVTSDKFLFGQYCPQCYLPPAEQQRKAFESRQSQIRQLASSQPGCQPYDNLRRIHVAGRFAGMPLLDFLDAYQPSIGREQWRTWIEAGQLREHHRTDSSPRHGNPAAEKPGRIVRENQRVREGQCFEQHMPNTVEPAINPDIELLAEDDSLVVVNKPAPLPSHPSGRFSRNTLVSLLAPAYPNEKLRVAHRLDANTSGVVVLCRKHQSARFVQPQFSNHQVDKIYVAKVRGHPDWESTRCVAAVGRQPLPHGTRAVCPDGDAAETDFQVLARLNDGTSLVEARPRSGRTHQIRIHLWHLGHPVVGDPLYPAGFQPGVTATLALGAPPMCLHAAQLTLTHPESRQRVSFAAPLPTWANPPAGG